MDHKGEGGQKSPNFSPQSTWFMKDPYTKSMLKVQLNTKTLKKPLHWRTSGFRFVMACDPVLVKNVIEKVVFRIPLSNFSTTIESIERIKYK